MVRSAPSRVSDHALHMQPSFENGADALFQDEDEVGLGDIL
jgi:hypothetical protein